jgi:hypothetical protein
MFKLLCDSKYISFKDLGNRMLSMFASMYNCEHIFSLMKLNKLYLGMWMRDESLAAVLHIATSTLTPNVEKHVSNCRQHYLSQ